MVMERGRSTPARNIEERTRHTRSRIAVWVRSPTTGSRKIILSRMRRPPGERRIEMNPATMAINTEKMMYHHVEKNAEELSNIRVTSGNLACSELKKTTKRGNTKTPK